MQCLSKFFISTTPFHLTNSPNSRTDTPAFRLTSRTHKIHYRTTSYDDTDSYITSRKRIKLPQNVETITSTSNPFVKHCVKLRQSSSYRHVHGSVIVVGTTTIRSILSLIHSARAIIHLIQGCITEACVILREICGFHSDRPIIECLFVLDNCCIPEEIDVNNIHIVHVNSEVIRKVSGVWSVDSVEVIALVRIPSTFHIRINSLHEEECRSLFSFPHRILVLDGIQDPGNLGTLVRSAMAFRW
ncbi:hypothetical protein OROGR_008268 [Orobanche gracilis]